MSPEEAVDGVPPVGLRLGGRLLCGAGDADGKVVVAAEPGCCPVGGGAVAEDGAKQQVWRRWFLLLLGSVWPEAIHHTLHVRPVTLEGVGGDDAVGVNRKDIVALWKIT